MYNKAVNFMISYIGRTFHGNSTRMDYLFFQDKDTVGLFHLDILWHSYQKKSKSTCPLPIPLALYNQFSSAFPVCGSTNLLAKISENLQVKKDLRSDLLQSPVSSRNTWTTWLRFISLTQFQTLATRLAMDSWASHFTSLCLHFSE